MSKPIIKINNLSKCYRIGTKERGYKTFREAIIDGISAPFRNFKRLQKLTKFNNNGDDVQNNDIIWALKDISFNVDVGEVVGIIGKNGAGKSTLLKILSRITEPTGGIIEINGRVSSLLEVGTGFHPELTGRENIFLNGAVLGMRKREIEKKFEEIINFAEIEKFIDTPVKRYSSGMYVRLAFAVAAHLEPEVLLVDEVLAVGDIAFQKKCLGKMKDIARGGRTVLFVSHNMGAILRLCTRCIVLEHGTISLYSDVSHAVNYYLKNKSTAYQKSWQDISKAPGNDIVRLRSIRFCDEEGNNHSSFDVRDSVIIEIIFQVCTPRQLAISVEFIGQVETNIMVSMDNYTKNPWGSQLSYSVGIYKSSCIIPGDFLNEGKISLNLWIYSPPFPPNESFHVRLIDSVNVTIGDNHNPEGVRGSYPYKWGTPLIRSRLHWTLERMSSDEDGTRVL